jgi:hypothetical protein
MKSLIAVMQLPLEDGQGVPMRRWWEVNCSLQYDRAESVLSAASRAWELYGPFDAVAGFSEGGAVAHLVSIAANQSACSNHRSRCPGAKFASLKFCIFFSAYSPDVSPVVSLPLPALHVFSTVDAAVAVERSRALADMYPLHGMRHVHSDGHCVPMRSKDISVLRSFLLHFAHPSPRELCPVTVAINHPLKYDIPPAQAEEQEALASIFENDYTCVTANPLQCQITIGWLRASSAAHDDLVPWIFLLFTLNSQYLRVPHGCPALRLCTKERNMITSLQEISIINAATQAIASCGGEPAIFAATSAARDWIDSHCPNGPSSASSVVGTPEHSFNVADDSPAHVHSWWEVEDIDMAEVLSAGAAASSVPLSQDAAGKEAGTASFNREWKLIVGLVGKPSSGKSTFFNAACRPSNLDSAARMAAHPFTTIEPNIGQAFAALPCPCKSADLFHNCSPRYGHAELPGTRRVPVVVKDVAGLVPGAYQGKGRGNAFLNDLVNCDVLIHVVDASGQTTASGVEGEGNPRYDIDWVVCCPFSPPVSSSC